MPIEKWAPTKPSLRRRRFSYSAGDVLLGRGHHVRLVPQRALAERDPDRRELLVLAPQSDEPPPAVPLLAVDRFDRPVRRGGRPAIRRCLRSSRSRASSAQASVTPTTLGACHHRGPGDEIAVDPTKPSRREAPGEPPGPHRSCLTHRGRQRGDSRAPRRNAPRETTRIPTFDEKSGDTVVDDVQQSTDRAGHDRCPTGRRFEGDESEALTSAGHHHDVGRSVVAGQDVVGLRCDEPNLVGAPPSRRPEPATGGIIATFGSARAAHDHQQRIGSAQGGQRSHGNVGPLQGLDATDEQDDRDVDRQPDGAASTDTFPWREERMLDRRARRSRWHRQGCRTAAGTGALLRDS